MDYKNLADFIFSDVKLTKGEIFEKYPRRELSENAKVTRIAPSPTGFMHLGNLYGAIVDERLAHQSEGLFYLRIEDTDKKREVANGTETIINAFNSFGINFDEGATIEGDNGAYGPYRQRQREEIYKVFVYDLMQRGLAYPCFCTEEKLTDMREMQKENKENFGYFGKYATCSNLSAHEAFERIKNGEQYVVRFRSSGDIANKIKHKDLVRGDMELTQNDQHVVILKSDGIPTYHFAHVVDDYLMGTTHVVRGEEWLATLPIHIELFDALGFKRPKYLHTAHLMKIDDETGSRRKLSKRLDPELALDFYHEKGFETVSVIEYLLTLLNSNFEDWRRANPDEPYQKFEFTTKKMSGSGALFDMNKLIDISKTHISKMSAEDVCTAVLNWAEKYDSELFGVLSKNRDFVVSILEIGRGGKKPRKDIAVWSEVKDYMGFMFDEYFKPDYTLPENTKADAKAILEEYINIYDDNDDQSVWFDKIKELSPKYGFAYDTKTYKANPEDFKGHSGDVSMIIRVAVCGRQSSPDMYSILKILGKEKVADRIKKAINEGI